MGIYEVTELLKELVGQELILSWAKVIFMITCTSLIIIELGVAYGISVFFFNLANLLERRKPQEIADDKAPVKWWDKIRKAIVSR